MESIMPSRQVKWTITRISHSERNRGYLNTFYQTRSDMTGFGAFGPEVPKSYTSAMFGMTWIELRARMRAQILDTVRDPSLIKKIKLLVHKFIPLRTGFLMQTIFKTMKVLRYAFTSSQMIADFDYYYPPTYPKIIKNPRHAPDDEGYGAFGTVKLTEPIPRSRVSWNHVSNTGLSAIYDLNDPEAIGNSEVMIMKEAERILKLDMINQFIDVILTCKL